VGAASEISAIISARSLIEQMSFRFGRLLSCSFFGLANVK